jgi:hypothetical protein
MTQWNYTILSFGRLHASRTILLTLLLVPGAFLTHEAYANADHGTEGAVVSDSAALENEYVRVMQNASLCTKAQTPGYGTRVIVALSDVSVESTKKTLALHRGEIVVFTADESYSTPRGEYFEVAFKLNHPPVKGPEQWIEPLKNDIVYSDDKLRIFQERLAPGDERDLHSHAQRVVVRLNAARLTDPRFHEAGSTKGSLQVPNTVKFAEPIVHVVRNVSDVPLFNVVIELGIPRQ